MVYQPKVCFSSSAYLCGGVAEGPDLDLSADLVDDADVFGEKEADQLLLHRPYDCPIELMLNCRIYSCLERELAALQDFIDKNLQKGFIQPLTSPLATLVLFFKKKLGELSLFCDYCKLNAITVRNRYLFILFIY